MKILTCNILLILLLGLSIDLGATEPLIKKEYTKEISETFDVSSNSKLGIKNKHGNITISTWNKSQIQIDVLIKVKSSNKEKGQQFLDAIDIDFQASSSKVRAETVYPDNNNSSWWNGWFGNNKNLDYEVHYTVQAPQDISSTLINKYGNITQASIGGDSDVTNKYGDIFFENVGGEFSLNLGYGKATVGSVGKTQMMVKYSEVSIHGAMDINASTKYSKFKIKTCNKVILQTKYDDYKIETVASIRNEGKYDEFIIGSVDEFRIDTKYTDVDINKLNHEATFDTKYGNVDIESTGNDLHKIQISSKYTGYTFTVDSDYHMIFDGSRTDLNVSDSAEKYYSDRDGSDLKVKAYRGSKSSGAEITAEMRYGSLKIR